MVYWKGIVMFKSRIWLVVVTFCLMFTSGCAVVSQGRMSKIHLEDLEWFESGITIRQEIVDEFGEPQKIIYRDNGIETLVYMHAVERRLFIPFVLSWGRSGGSGENLIINFQDDILINYELIIDQRYLTD